MNELVREPVVLATGSERTRVEIRGSWCGPDLLVSITGGTAPHIGAVALAQPRPSLRGDGTTSATASVLTLSGHKEDELARWAALCLASRLSANVIVTAGLHVDHASAAEICELDASARSLVDELARQPRPA